MTHDVYADGVLAERWDDETRTYTDYRVEPAESRPYNAAENAAADATATAQTEAANDTEIGNKIETVDMVAMQAIIDQTNEALRLDPSQEVKDLARAVRRLDRKVQRLLDGTD